MKKAFVFGKFLPFHRGHEAMIRFAAAQCDLLKVLICCSDQENIPCSVRKSWIAETCADRKNIEIQIYHYRENELPNTSESSEAVSRVWAEVFRSLLPGHSLLISSEPYGDFVAGFMGIRHIPFDIPRTQFPVSSTAVRTDLFAAWKYLPGPVKRDLCLKVVLLGTESTGKTTLTLKLARHFQCSPVPETAREMIADSNRFGIDDLERLAREHAKRIDRAVLGDSPLVVIDTDVYITQSYARFALKTELEVDEAIQRANRAHLYLYLNNDVEHIQDGTRLSEAERDLLDVSHRQVLKERGVQFVEITGNWEERFERAVAEIKALIAQNKIRQHSF